MSDAERLANDDSATPEVRELAREVLRLRAAVDPEVARCLEVLEWDEIWEIDDSWVVWCSFSRRHLPDRGSRLVVLFDHDGWQVRLVSFDGDLSPFVGGKPGGIFPTCAAAEAALRERGQG